MKSQNIGIVCVYPRGAWNVATAYQKLALVSHNNAAYIATQDNVGVEPGVSAGWTLSWMLLLNNPNPETIVVDDAMSSVSENPVQNKVITAALGNKLSLTGGTVSGTLNADRINASQGLNALDALISGSLTVNGVVNIDDFDDNHMVISPVTGKITGLIGTPTDPSDAVPKSYADDNRVYELIDEITTTEDKTAYEFDLSDESYEAVDIYLDAAAASAATNVFAQCSINADEFKTFGTVSNGVNTTERHTCYHVELDHGRVRSFAILSTQNLGGNVALYGTNTFSDSLFDATATITAVKLFVSSGTSIPTDSVIKVYALKRR